MEPTHIYLLIGEEWEDAIIYLTKEDAIKASINNPFSRVEIFSKTDNHPGYMPTYSFYSEGKLYKLH